MIAAFFARRGARMLDRVEPGWVSWVESGALSMASASLCVLGQMYGSYWHGLEKLGFGSFRSASYGFIDFFPFSRYHGLNKAWQEEIATRQDARQLTLAA